MAEIVFLGASGGVFKTLSTLATRAGFRGTLTATEDRAAFTKAVSQSKVGLAGPLLFDCEYDLATNLDLHSRIFYSTASARIPKGGLDLYSTAVYNILVPHGKQTLAPSTTDFSTAEALATLGSRAGGEKLALEWTEFSKKVADEVVALADQGAFTAVDVARVPNLADTVQTPLWDAVGRAITASGHGKPQMERSMFVVRSPGIIANRLILHPERVATVVIPPLEETSFIPRLAEGLTGGRGIASYVWRGGGGTVYHTAAFEDGPQANPVGACVALCQLLLASKDAATADRLYAALQKAAMQGNTYTLAGEGKLEAAVSAAL